MPGITDGEQGLVIKWRYSINRQVHPTEYVALLDLTPDKNGTINYVIKSPGDRQFIIVSSYVKIYQRYFMLDYIQDITSLKTERSELWKRISLTLFTIDLCLFLLLHVIIKRAFEPLKQLKGQAKAMAEGDYSLKAEILYRDEVGQLAESFNQLADAVRAHIHTLSETAKLKELFAANLAHEIKTPLTSIVAYADYCAAKSSMKRDELQGILEFIKLEGQRIGALSDTILK